MIYDCFTFYNELDLLDIRLHELYDIVDKFVIVEGTHEHSGKKKESVFQRNRSRFNDVSDKIIWHLADLESYKTTTERENAQRNAIKELLLRLPNEPDKNDIITICDLDEIPDKKLKLLNPKSVIGLKQTFHYYYLNNIAFNLDGTARLWTLPRVCKWWYLKNSSPQQIRMTNLPPNLLHSCGWHYSFMGGPEQISDKIKAFLHQEFNTPFINNKEYIENAVKNNVDLFSRKDRTFRLVKDTEPDYVKSNLEKFKYLIYEENK